MKPYIFDTETTGTDHENDQIIEAAWLELPEKPHQFAQTRSPEDFPHYLERFRPSVPIQLGAQATHHIICSDLVGCRESKAFKLPKDIGWMIGHNIDFDAKFSKGMKLKRICTLAISRFLFPDKDSHTQSAMIYMIGRRYSKEEWARGLLKNAHAALDDVRNNAILLRFLLSEAMDKGHACDTWDEVLELSNTARIPTVMGFGKHKGTPIVRGQLDPGYVRWYRQQPETDEYLLEAFKRAGF